jgi:hypothetical protein
VRYPNGLERAEDLAGRTLRVEVEGWVDPDLTSRDADALGTRVASAVSARLPRAGSLAWVARAAPE